MTSLSSTRIPTSIEITLPSQSSELLEGFENKIQKFTGIAGIRKAVKALSWKLDEGKTTNQYLFFQPVTVKDFGKFEDQRSTIQKGLRITHCADIETLIIKVPTAAHEFTKAGFEYLLMDCCRDMRIPLRDRIGVGSATYKGLSTSKEADGGFKPASFRPHLFDWPTLVLEVGISESLRKLRNDAKWWLSNSRGNVNIVLIIHINETTKTMFIEKWETTQATGGPNTRSNRSAQIPTPIQGITINPNGITANPPLPLVLHFRKFFLRAPTEAEHDLSLTEQDLREWSNAVWGALI